MTGGDGRGDLLRPFADAPDDALIAVDFDGTLSPIVQDPASARPVDGAIEVLEDLSGRVGELAVVSGRPLEFLEQWFPMPSDVTIVGLYGLETRRRGVRQDHPTSGVWRETVADLASRARIQGPSGMVVEPKGMSLTLHYRQTPELAEAVARWAEEAAGPAGMRVRPAKMSVEVHPPIDEDKGTVLARLAADHAGPVLYAGDDVGDIPAFTLLERMRESGRDTVRLLVDSDEAPVELRGMADILVADPAEMSVVLAGIARDISAP